jgi:hypothetical protein
MPSPISHLYYAQRLAEKYPVEDMAAYLRGTVFPDIRYLGVIDRSKSHRTDVKLEEVMAEQNSWKRGYLLHCWLDSAWNGYWLQFGLDTDKPSHQTLWMAVKLAEDERLYPSIFDKPGLATVLIRPDDEALAYGVKAGDISRWGKLVGHLLLSPPTADTRAPFYRELSIGHNLVELIERHIDEITSDSQWTGRFDGCQGFIEAAWNREETNLV